MYPKVSIIMNCFNGDKYLYDAINSVIIQKYENWELIFWDNLSIDKSYEIFNKFKDPRLKYYKATKFTNLSEARNLAIAKSTGELLTFLDVDDIWSDNKLLVQVEYFLKNKFLLIYSNFFVKNEKKLKKKIYSYNKLPEGNITQQLLNNYSVGLLTIMISKKIIDEIYFNEKYTIIGDFDMVIRISKKYKIGSIQTPLATYRKHGQNDSILNLEKQINELNAWYKNALNDINYKNNYLNKVENKIIFMKFENSYNKKNYSKMLSILMSQRDIVYIFKMILYLILPKIIVRYLKK